MKVKDRQFMHIDSKYLKGMNTFPFHIFVYNPFKEIYIPFLEANTPLTPEKVKFINLVLSKKGVVAIDIKQKKTFMRALELSEEDLNKQPVGKESNKENDELASEAKQAKKQVGKENAPSINVSKEIAIADQKNDFSEIIKAARLEILALSPKVSQTVSLARFLAKTLLTQDTPINRIVALSFYLTKKMDVLDDEPLGDIVVGSFLSQLGTTQIDLSIVMKPHMKFTPSENKSFEKQSGLSHHLIKRVGLDISDECLKILLQYRERADGSGSPEGKTIQQLSKLSLVLGVITHAVEYSLGNVTGDKTPLQDTLMKIATKADNPGLNFEFGDKILEGIKLLASKARKTDMAA